MVNQTPPVQAHPLLCVWGDPKALRLLIRIITGPLPHSQAFGAPLSLRRRIMGRRVLRIRSVPDAAAPNYRKCSDSSKRDRVIRTVLSEPQFCHTYPIKMSKSYAGGNRGT